MARFIMLNCLNFDTLGYNKEQVEEFCQSRGGFLWEENTETTEFISDDVEVVKQYYIGARALDKLADISVTLGVNGSVIQIDTVYMAQDSEEVVPQ